MTACVCVPCQISRPVASRSGPFAGFAIDVGTTPRRQRWRSVDWPASTGLLRIPRREARRANFPDMKGRSTMVVNLIMRPCRLRSFANQTGPRRSETSGRADLSGTGQSAAARTRHRPRPPLVPAARFPGMPAAGSGWSAASARGSRRPSSASRPLALVRWQRVDAVPGRPGSAAPGAARDWEMYWRDRHLCFAFMTRLSHHRAPAACRARSTATRSRSSGEARPG